MSTPTFQFGTATTTRGLIASGEGSTEFLHPMNPTDLPTSNGFMLVLNGWNLNRRLADTTGYNNAASTAVQLLQMRAPRNAIVPAVSWMGHGRIIGRDYFWRYRWKDSRTGEVSGLSPLPTQRIDLGTEQPIGGDTFLGQNAAFVFSVTDAPAHADTVEVFRCASQEPNVVYLVKSKALSGLTTLSFVDDLTDDEIVLNEEISLRLPSGPTWDQGILYPVCKAWSDPVGRTMYYGIRRWRRFACLALTATVTGDSDLVTIDNVSATTRLIEPGRIGQRFRLFQDSGLTTDVAETTVYRIIKVESASTFRITPAISTGLLASGASSSLYFAIEDDRDARISFMSEPGKPWLIDPAKAIATGDDYDDGVMAWFSLNGIVYCQTRRRIYAALNYATIAPHLSITYQPIVSEGMVGFDAGCITPFGWVYVHEQHGVRLFDGSMSMPLGPDLSPHMEFKPRTQFQNFDRASLETCVVIYDAEHHSVIVSYVPDGQGTRKETLVYSVPDKDWRGPYRERVAAAGFLRTTSSEDKLVCGDDFGNLSTREEQVLDMVPASPNTLTTTGTITTSAGRLLTDSSATFNADSDERLRGCPIWFLLSGTYYYGRIADVISGTQIELDGLAVDEDGNQASTLYNATYGIGSIRWTATTAYIDGGEPVFPKRGAAINIRFKRGTDTTSFEMGCSEDANGSYLGQYVVSGTATAPTNAVTSSVSARFIFERVGTCFQFRARGISRDGDPQATGAVLVMTVDKGQV